eukprot:403369670
MQHNFQDFLRLGTHWIHSSQSIVKNLTKRDIVNQNLQDIYSQEYFDHFYEQSKQQNDGCIINSAVSANATAPKDLCQFNKLKIISQMEEASRQLTKQRLFSVQDQDYDSSQEFDYIETIEDDEIQSIKEINLQMEKMLENDNDETQTQDQSENDVRSIQRNLQWISSQAAEQNPINSARTEKVLVIDKVVSDNDNTTFNQSDMQSNFNFSKLGVVRNNFLINPYQARYSFDNQNYFNYAPEQIQDEFTVNRKGPYSVQDNQYYNNNVKDDTSSYQQGFKNKYKTEICRNWELYGYCEFSQSCSFAHGEHELQRKQHVPQNYKTKLCKQFHEHLYCPYGMRCQFLHSETKSESKQDIEYSKKLEQNVQLVQEKLKPDSNLIKFETQSAKQKSKKNKDPLEGIFGKGKRLPVFAVITFTNKDQCKKQIKSKNKTKSKKVHKFNKQHSENLTGFKGLEILIESSNSPTPQLSARKPNKKKIIISSQDDKLQE